jgi:hypothetical protein
VEELIAQLLKFQPLIAVLVGVASGAWVLRRHYARREHDPRIQFRVGVRLVGHHGKHWVVELLAFMQNRGEVPHRMSALNINLRGLRAGDPMVVDPTRFRGQLPFPHALVPPDGGEQSLMPEVRDNRVMLYPSTSMRYMYVAIVDDSMRFLLIHGTLERVGAEPLRADRVVRVPRLEPHTAAV